MHFLEGEPNQKGTYLMAVLGAGSLNNYRVSRSRFVRGTARSHFQMENLGVQTEGALLSPSASGGLTLNPNTLNPIS